MPETFNFGEALRFLLEGHKLARTGWNGKNMWIIHVPGTEGAEIKPDTPYAQVGLEKVDILPHIDMMTATGQMLPGWLASQTDMLADDWMLVA